MSNTKHTPGPWRLYDKPKVKQNQWVESIGARDRGDIICLAPSVEHIDSLEMWADNAKLIAAAPEMLEALKLVAEYHEHDAAWSEYGDKIKSAIKKATE